tara:strand:+ start:63 stop:278 length:216 start_codon:yes stop_codon:yes gene_type:complete
MNIDKVNEIIKFYGTYKFEDYKPIEIEGCQKIIDLRTFVKRHIIMVRANINNDRYKPYYDRLVKVYLISKI